ncbi:MAG TPA: PorV/PorQ family protein [Saprospiraceae bacterium]|nr:PorV/PorQ family protein [Saprospiraceae bacterium]MCB9320656.1 PorV/PorQ family protein [Lewinellaceae bacterium]HPG07109.1 PorV/PorQ family protein [Saprospiraceae bacterium]HPQ97916.1 PorV/PorQ family protein [Saprospiraceae bacterium]HQU53649.1 PorV/PorQ family protein [Saprospiraceae bacterium]
MTRIYLIGLILMGILAAPSGRAGNPDRQGEAGAYELTLNPWARSAGLHSLTTACIQGAEAMRLNVAGMTRIHQTEVLLGHTIYLKGSDVRLNALGFVQKVGKNGAFGISLMSLNLGDIVETSVQQPEGTGATFSPNFFHLGMAYAHTFENKVSVGILFRGISESTANLSAFGFALDAGVQYVTGPQDNFKFGISLRNIGSPMRFGGEGLSIQETNPDGTLQYNLTYDQRSASFELPSMLNIGMSYDLYAGDDHRFTLIGNFTSNSFSRDNLGGGMEYCFKDLFFIRGAYKYELGTNSESVDHSVYTGLSAGMGFEVPLKKGSDYKLGIDYGYRATNPFQGSHSIAFRISI